MAKRHATITAFTVEVSCPHCGEPVEEPSTGSFYWEPKQVGAVGAAPRECNACEETFCIVPQSRVSIPATLAPRTEAE